MLTQSSRPDDTLAADAIGWVLANLQLVGVSHERSYLPGAWSFLYPTQDHAWFHFVDGRGCWIRGPDGRWSELSPGDAVLLPKGGEHVLASDPDLPARHFYERDDALRAAAEARRVQHLPEEDGSTFFCGTMRFHLHPRHPISTSLPDMIWARDLIGSDPAIPRLIEAMMSECASPRIGSAAVLAKLADVLAAQIIRAWVEQGAAAAPGWFAAVRHPSLGRVLNAIHAEPERAWSVADLAALMGTSRSGFSAKFTAALGVGPSRYVTAVRLHRARAWIADEGASVAEIAERLGYDSEASFSRAFKRVLGETPGQARAQATH